MSQRSYHQKCKKVKDEINEGSFVCPNKHKFAITDGIPRFVVDTTKDFVRTEEHFPQNGRIIMRIIMQKTGLIFKQSGF